MGHGAGLFGAAVFPLVESTEDGAAGLCIASEGIDPFVGLSVVAAVGIRAGSGLTFLVGERR